MTAHERRHQEDCTSHACFPNPLFRNSLCILFYLVQDQSLALPSGAASSMWLHSLSKNSFRQAGGRGSKLLRHSRHLQISLESCGFRPQNQHQRSPCTPPATIGMRVARSPLVLSPRFSTACGAASSMWLHAFCERFLFITQLNRGFCSACSANKNTGLPRSPRQSRKNHASGFSSSVRG